MVILAFITICAFNLMVHAQTGCAEITVEAIPNNPQTGTYNLFAVKVTLDKTYDQDITVTGYIYDDGGSPNTDHPYSLTVTAGNLTAETEYNFYQTCPACNAAANISSIAPLSVTSKGVTYDLSNCFPVDLTYLKPQSNEVITTGHDLYINFVNTTGIFQKYTSLSITDQNLDLVTLADPKIKVIVIPITGVGASNKLLAVCNTENSQYMYFFMEFSISTQLQEIKSKLYDKNNTYIYSTFQTNTSFDLSLPSQTSSSRVYSCFSECMDRQESNFESTFIGWLYWNVLPNSSIVQAAAAINCLACCEGWWKNKGC